MLYMLGERLYSPMEEEEPRDEPLTANANEAKMDSAAWMNGGWRGLVLFWADGRLCLYSCGLLLNEAN